MLRLLATALAATLAAGCTYVRPLDVNDAGRRQAVSERAARQQATVLVAGGAPVPVQHLSIGSDSTSWMDARTGTLHVVPTAAVEAVRFPRAERSALGDLLIGAGASFVGGALFGAAIYEEGGTLMADSRGAQMLLFGTFFGALGGTVGGVSALDSFSPERYVPTSDSTATR